MTAGRDFLRRYGALLGLPESDRLVAILAMLFETEAERRLAAALPGNVEDLAGKVNLPVGEVRAVVRRLEERGAITVAADHEVFRLLPYLFQLRDATIIAADASPSLLELWGQLLVEELPGVIAELKKQRLPALVEVHPAPATLVGCSGQATDGVTELIEGAEVIAALPCACRTQARHAGGGEGCPAPHPNLCILTDQHARAALRRQVAEKISREEARSRLDNAARAGLVHTLSHNPRTGMHICNCCPCCCSVLEMVNDLDYPESLLGSKYRAAVDPRACGGCETCVERCPFGCIAVDGEPTASVAKQCYGCGCCVLTCPEGALTLEERRQPWRQ